MRVLRFFLLVFMGFLLLVMAGCPGLYERLLTKGCSMTKMILPVILWILTQGCVGIGALKTHTETFQDPTLSDTARVKGLWSANSSQAVSNAFSATWLKTHWGEPKS